MIKEKDFSQFSLWEESSPPVPMQAEKGDSDDMTKKTHELNPVVVTGTEFLSATEEHSVSSIGYLPTR